MTTTSISPVSSPTVLVAHPSADVYGADLQLLESISALTASGSRVSVVLPADGPLVRKLRERGAGVDFVRFPVLRRANASAVGILRLAWCAGRTLPDLWRAVRRHGADVVYVNTLTIPWWIAAARLSGRPVICHVHEAETDERRLVGALLNGPLLMASTVLVNSATSLRATCSVVRTLRRKCRLVYNGVGGPPPNLPRVAESRPFRLVAISRLSPRKAPHIALQALALLRHQGRDVALEICGTAFPGYEDYVAALHERAAQPSTRGVVTFSGYVSPVWDTLAGADVFLAPSLREPFGNAVVESQLAGTPVVAAAAGGHLETVVDEMTGLLVRPGDAEAMARAVARLMDDEALRERIVVTARREARRRFSLERYRATIVDAVGSVCAHESQDVGVGGTTMS